MVALNRRTTLIVFLAIGAVSWLPTVSTERELSGTDASSHTEVIDYGNITFATASQKSNIIALRTSFQVPRTPEEVGTVFMWPGLQPAVWGTNFLPIDNGVLQSVLSWGTSCAKGQQPKPPYSTWWISAQYVNTIGHEPNHIFCYGGDIMTVSPGDHLTVNMTLSGTTWTQTVSDQETGKTVTWDEDLLGQSQNYAVFSIEPHDSARSIPTVTFRDTTITFSHADDHNCDLQAKGIEDVVSIPILINGGQQCSIEEITLKPAPDPTVCPQHDVVKSKRANKQATVTFKNSRGATVNLFWLNYIGARDQKPFATIKDGDTLVVQTFQTHAWLVMDLSGGCVDLYVVPEEDKPTSPEHTIP
jgi:VHL beta domain